MNSEQRAPYSDANRFLHLVDPAFTQNGWRAPRFKDSEADLVIEKNGLRYVVALKFFSDGNRSRLLPLLSMAILESKVWANSRKDLRPMAVIMAPYIKESVVANIGKFAAEHAPDVAIGVLDFDGLRRFWGEGVDELNSEHPSQFRAKLVKDIEAGSNLFSDVNQWLLKILLGQKLPKELINVPYGELQNASQFASLANVSVMSAFRFIRQLESEGFLDAGSPVLHLVNIERLLDRWHGAMLKPQRQIRCRWLIRGGNEERLINSVRQYQESNPGPEEKEWSVGPRFQPQIRMCLGGFAAASRLGFGHVSGVPPLIYLERINGEILRQLGLAKIEDSRPAEVFVRVPAFKQALFRAAIIRDGIRISDILQIWLDSSVNPTRGLEQANVIKTRLLDPIIRENV